MVARAIWPLAVYYPGSRGFVNLATTSWKNDDYDDVVKTHNLLAIDALEYTEISRARGKTKRVCTRTSVFVPWTPILYVAVHSDHASEFRKRLNCRLLMSKRSPCAVTMRANVHGLVRASDRVLWCLRNMELCELRFDSYASRSIALRYLRDNAHARAHQYSLFATDDSTCLEIALTSYFRNGNSSLDDNSSNDDGGGEDNGGEKNTGNDGIDLRKVFEMGSWCRVDDNGGRIVKMSAREIQRNQLPPDPLVTLPVVSYDIETIARMDSTLPRGVEEDQRLSSIAITVHHHHHHHHSSSSSSSSSNSNDNVVTVPIYLAYVPLDDEQLKRYESLVRQKLRLGGPTFERAVVRFYRDERDLLSDALKILRYSEFFADLYRLDNPADAARVACLLIGYNSWEYDYAFLTNRAVYYGMYDEAFAVMRFHLEPRFAATQLSLDLMKHVQTRYQLGSNTLKHVSAYFGANEAAERNSTAFSRREKMVFDAISIRRMYFDRDGGDEVFDRDMAFGDLNVDQGVNMLRVSLYNLQDCTAVYYLMRNLSLLPSIALYSRHFYATFWDSSHAGNSRLLPNAFVVRSLLSGGIVLPYRRNEHSLLTMSPAILTDGSNRPLISPRSPQEIAARWSGEHRRVRCHDQGSVMRISEKQTYIGGINSATSGHYVRPICVDFTSFYPSIGCQYELSMETVYIVTCDHLLEIHDRDETLLDRTMAEGIVRCFDYEPVDSPYRRHDDGWQIRGRDAFAEAVIRHNNGWYEGVEFTRAREIVESSADRARRRVLVICRTTSLGDGQPPIICSLWRHYLDMRKRYKEQLRTTTDVFQRRVLSCQEKMFKVVANSLYGYLNYARSIVYSPQVAAAVTLLSRKTFHETAWICESVLPATVRRCGGDGAMIKCDVVYRDTDGLIVFIATAAGSSVSAEQQREYESLLTRLINDTFSRYGYPSIRIDLEDSGVEACCIMGKKKYWKTLCLRDERFVTKGFEKNAQTFVKHIVRVLQRNVSGIIASAVSSCDLARGRLAIVNYREFFASMYTALDAYYAEHGPDAFSFNLALNPRHCAGAEANFIQRTIERFGYSPGDRVKCVFSLDTVDPGATAFRLLRDFRRSVDRLNYYKIIRRLATYFVQLTEGFRNNNTNDDDDDRAAADDETEFDAILHGAYVFWLNSSSSSSTAARSSHMDALFHNDGCADWVNWLAKNSSLVRLVAVKS